MEKDNVEDYIQKLQSIEKQLSEDGESGDLNFMGDLTEILNKLGGEIEEELDTGHIKVDVKVKKLHSNAVLPSYSKEGDAGLDLTVTEVLDNSRQKVKFGFGIAMEIPKGYVGLIFPRSSVHKTKLTLSNCVGVVDSGYRGEVMSIFRKIREVRDPEYKVGDRVAQIIIIPYPTINIVESEELSETERGSGGFGSSGR